VFQFVELKRWEDIKKPGSQGEPGSFLGLEASFASKDTGYPGGFFDPLNLVRVFLYLPTLGDSQ